MEDMVIAPDVPSPFIRFTGFGSPLITQCQVPAKESHDPPASYLPIRFPGIPDLPQKLLYTTVCKSLPVR